MPKGEVCAQIEEAFADTPAPGDDFDDISATKWDEGVVGYFRGRTWRGHRVEDLRHHEAALSFFTGKAFRYWLPAFILAELENPEGADIIAEGIAFSPAAGESADARLRQFAQDELEAIAAFLDECARRYADGTHDTFREAENCAGRRGLQATKGTGSKAKGLTVLHAVHREGGFCRPHPRVQTRLHSLASSPNLSP